MLIIRKIHILLDINANIYFVNKFSVTLKCFLKIRQKWWNIQYQIRFNGKTKEDRSPAPETGSVSLAHNTIMFRISIRVGMKPSIRKVFQWYATSFIRFSKYKRSFNSIQFDLIAFNPITILLRWTKSGAER